MKNNNREVKKLYKADLMRYFKFLLIALPFLFIIACVFAYYKLSSSVSIALTVLSGLVLCSIMELVYYIRLKKQAVVKEKTKKLDPYKD